MKIHIDEAKCVGGGQCVLAAPEVFDQRDEDGVAFLVAEDPEPELHEQVHEAARLCPALAIEVIG
jgi:ferredoxin